MTTRESHTLDRKSLRLVTGARASFDELAQACVCFANAAGGTLLVGIEDDADAPPTSQRVDPALLREAGLDVLTTLKRVQPHRLRALILEDLERFPDSSKADIWRRVGPEIPERTFRRALEDLVTSDQIVETGETRARRFGLKSGVSGHDGDDGQ